VTASRREMDIRGEARLHNCVQAGDFYITHKSYTHDFEQSWHEHPEGSIDFILDGGGLGTYGGREIRSAAGMVEFFREGVRHRFRSDVTGIRSMHVVLPGEMLSGIAGLRHIGVEEMSHTRAIGLASRLLGELTRRDRSSCLEIESLSHELLDEVVGVVSTVDRRAGWIGAVRDVLHSVTDRGVTLGELSGVAGVSKGHLAREFRGAMGVSVGEYHRRVRIERAARELAQGDESIARIGFGCGFVDQAHFTRVFGELYGVTPGVFRASLKG
jgi:AraC family transcriptional regulator